jgi:hypothetical protein
MRSRIPKEDSKGGVMGDLADQLAEITSISRDVAVGILQSVDGDLLDAIEAVMVNVFVNENSLADESTEDISAFLAEEHTGGGLTKIIEIDKDRSAMNNVVSSNEDKRTMLSWINYAIWAFGIRFR